MSSPNPFQTPLTARDYRPSITNTAAGASSPDLPDVNQLLSQIPGRQSAIQSGSKAQPIPSRASASSFTTAEDRWRSTQSECYAEASVVEVEPENIPKPTKGRQRKNPAETRCDGTTKKTIKRRTAAAKATDEGTDAVDDGTKGKQSKGAEASKRPAAKNTRTKKKGGNGDGGIQRLQYQENESDDVLQLEHATTRRVDWTPPHEKQQPYPPVASDVSATQDATSSAQDGAQTAAVFTNLLEDYGCNDQLPRQNSAAPEDTSSFLKKRKLIEVVSIGDSSRSRSETSVSPTKEKPAKRKPRTITELATAAYRPFTPNETTAPPSGSMHAAPAPGAPGANAVKGALGKKKAPAARKSRRKPRPPSPILLSPSSALAQVSKQDFVFGTSSQLVREQSPTFLRDIQAAIRDSNQMGWDPADDNVRDGDRSLERRRRLWEAGARDVDGRLFDMEIVDHAKTPAEGDHIDNPFSYSKPEAERIDAVPGSPHDDPFETLPDVLPPSCHKLAEKPVELDVRGANVDVAVTVPPKVEDDGFETLSDILPLPPPPSQCPAEKWAEPETPGASADIGTAEDLQGEDLETLSDILPAMAPRRSPPIMNDDGIPFSSSQISVSSDLGRPMTTNEASEMLSNPTIPTPTLQTSTAAPEPSRQPQYDMYTDAQLASEIRSYGFKPVKKRIAMIALLEQCWQSKHPPGIGVRTVTTSAKPSHSAAVSVSPKRPRGRPRKNIPAMSQTPQEPPPSAQPPSESPAKRPRGRPRKTASAASPSKAEAKTTAVRKTTKAATTRSPSPPSQRKSPTTPKRHASPKKNKTIIEIPDSASDNDSNMFASPASTLCDQQTFSSPSQGIDLSVTVDDDAEKSLAAADMNDDQKEAVLFDKVTRAVTTAPRSTDPANPSWYEKILMYDPIVLEDITGWLNAGQLSRVGYDWEISPGEVKRWCESRSVCCLWRVNLRGKERKRC
ncbi:endonuclease regulatory subunit [Geosmithia morbida]|uniref:Structure-specific endonuclease subunit SLX4 n=1 Tax=Geosmithia morbida TaxID=1094350 RepID=A0A9P4YXN8_9HYPO|nr:endonuclease regulatory subunit [Geosmithia morbida]KAF4124988.1 endonuclease regulatory subunit [Geosmithia morbida]